jgi:hypothetical protein
VDVVNSRCKNFVDDSLGGCQLFSDIYDMLLGCICPHPRAGICAPVAAVHRFSVLAFDRRAAGLGTFLIRCDRAVCAIVIYFAHVVNSYRCAAHSASLTRSF